MKKHWAIIKANFSQILTYRARVVIWAFVNVAEICIFPFIWLTVYAARGEAIAGYTAENIVTYYIIVAFIGIGFVSHITKVIKQDILYGKINTYITRPINYSVFQLIHESVYKCFSITTGLILIGGIAVVAGDYFLLPQSPAHLALFTIALLETFLITQALETIIGYMSFWFGEIRALEHANDILLIFFSGALAPLAFFPPFFQSVADILPYKFTAAIPTQIYLGELSAGAALQGLFLGAVWVIVLFTCAELLWRRAQRTYEGIGI